MVNNRLDRSFGALAHPVRRRIVQRLSAGPSSVATVSRNLAVSKPAITKHVRVLEEAGLIVREIEGRTHTLSLRARALGDAEAWMQRTRRVWEAKFDAVEQFLVESSGSEDPA